MAPRMERKPGLLAYVDGLPRAHECLVLAVAALDGKRSKYAQTSRFVENLIGHLHFGTSRSMLHQISQILRGVVLWMPVCDARFLLAEAMYLLISAPDYSRVVCDGSRTLPRTQAVG